jgi:hypothetical protein
MQLGLARAACEWTDRVQRETSINRRLALRAWHHGRWRSAMYVVMVRTTVAVGRASSVWPA